MSNVAALDRSAFSKVDGKKTTHLKIALRRKIQGVVVSDEVRAATLFHVAATVRVSRVYPCRER